MNKTALLLWIVILPALAPGAGLHYMEGRDRQKTVPGDLDALLGYAP